MSVGAPNPRLLVAFNFEMRDKMTSDLPKSVWWKFNNGFTNVEFTVDEAIDAVHRGHSFCPRHLHRHADVPDGKGGTKKSAYRHSVNYIPTNVVGIDFDGGTVSLESLKQDPLFLESGGMAYTTVSSTNEDGGWRLRAVWVLEKPIVKLENMRYLKRALAFLKKTDPCDGIAMHAYSGNRKDNFLYIRAEKNVLRMSEAERLVNEYRKMLAIEQEEARRAAERRLAEHPELANFPDVTDVAEMLRHLDSDVPYDQWIVVLMAVHSRHPDQIGIDLCNTWSMSSTRYTPGCVERAFKSFTHKGIGIGRLIKLAVDKGYEAPHYRIAREQREREREEKMFAQLALQATRSSYGYKKR